MRSFSVRFLHSLSEQNERDAGFNLQKERQRIAVILFPYDPHSAILKQKTKK